MVPQHLIKPIDERLTREIGQVPAMKQFVFIFASLQKGHDLEYALMELKKPDLDPVYRQGIKIFVEEIARGN
jgi:hypothetical protein